MSPIDQHTRAAELLNRCDRGDLTEQLADHLHFLDTLMYLHEALAEENVPIQHWQKDSETLLFKYWQHGCSMNAILAGIAVHSSYHPTISGIKLRDIASAKVIFRAQLEAFLMYHHVYVNPADDDLKQLRYYAWMYTGLKQRQSFPAQSDFAKTQRQKDAEEIGRIAAAISKLNSFGLLSEKQQKQLLEKGSAKLFLHWVTILKETGFDEKSRFHTVYEILSVYSHSEGISVVQMAYQPGGQENVKSQALLDLWQSSLLCCFLIKSITKLYPAVEARYQKLSEVSRFDIDFLSGLAKNL